MTTRSLLLLPLLLMQQAQQPVAAQQRLLGGDISMLPAYVEAGTVYRDAEGNAVRPLDYLQGLGWNTMRVRLFVHPAEAPRRDGGVVQDLTYVTRLARQIRQAGLRLMLDFHYSDTWADPAQQLTPLRWQQATADVLADSVYQHTRAALTALAAAGAAPQLIQVGNETTNGMLWPTGRVDPSAAEGWDTLCRLLSAGCRACREVCPEARIIIHTEKAGRWPLTRNYYRQLGRHGVDYDIVGLSYYPMWHGTVPNLGQTLDSLQRTFPDKEVMIVEAAALYDGHVNTPEEQELYPCTVDGQRQYTRELVDELLRHPNVTGLFWWFPEENAHHNSLSPWWLNRGLFDNRTGRALPALYELSRWR